MNTTTKRGLAAGVLIALVVGVGAAGAIAANDVLSPSEESQAVIDDAATQLGVEPAELSSALRQALKNRIDAAVEAGRLTREQADELRTRIDDDELPLFGPGRMGPGFHGRGLHRAEVFAAAASHLGLTEAELRAELQDGTLAEIAKERGKSVTGLVSVMVAAVEKSIDQAVADGKLTKEQADAMKSGLEERMTARVNGELGSGPAGPHGHGFGHMGGGMGSPGFSFHGPPMAVGPGA